jgi:hypothetical protein
MTNREKLNSECMYDLLCRMNKKTMPYRCMLQVLDDKQRVRTRCDEYGGEFGTDTACPACIAAWLNEIAE